MQNFIYIRGLVRESRHWDMFIPYMKEKFPNDNHIAIDYPGVGDYFEEKSPTNVQDLVIRMREKLGQKIELKNLHLISVSLGSMMALTWEHLFPNEVLSLVLINTSIKGITPIYHRVMPKSMIQFLKIISARTIEKKEKLIVDMVNNNKKVKDEILDKWLKIQKERPVTKINSLRQTFAGFKYTFKKPHLDPSKIFIIAGKGDKLCHFNSSVLIQEKLGGKLKLHHWGGHNLIDDDPIWLQKELEEFYTGIN